MIRIYRWIALLTIWGMLLHAQEKFEPADGRVLHGLGQYISVFYSDAENWQYVTEYQNGSNQIPVIYSAYTAIDPYLNSIDFTDFGDIVSNHGYPYVLLVGLTLFDSSYFSGNIHIPAQEILSGALDYRIIDIAQRIQVLDAPVYLRPGYEFGNGNSGIHNDPNLTPAEFINIWIHIYNVFEQQGVTNVAWVWNTVNPDLFNYNAWYPGDEYVDWWGINYFTLGQIFNGDGFLNDAAVHGKPVMICESSPIQNGGTTNPANWNLWFVPYFNKIKNTPQIKAFVYISDPWDRGPFASWPDSRITSDPTIKNNYATELLNPVYLHMGEYQTTSVFYPYVTTPVPDVSYPEDSGVHSVVMDLHTVFADPETGDTLDFSATVDDGNIQPTIAGNSLQVTFAGNYFGSANVVVTAADIGGLSVNDTFIVTVTPVNDPPLISGLPDTLRFVNDTTLVIWNYVDDVETPDSLLSYQFMLSNDSLSISYDTRSGVAILTGQAGFSGESQLTLTVADDSGAVAQASVVLHVFSQPVGFSETFPAGWNLIGLPLNVPDAYYLTLFPAASPGTLFGWTGSYTTEDTLKVGQGYWLRFPAADTVSIAGSGINSISRDILPGWNLIAGISGDIAFTDISDPAGILIPGTLFGFNGGYYPADTLRQGEGYWVRASDSGQVVIAAAAASRGIGIPPRSLAGLTANPPDPGTLITLEIIDSAGNRRELLWNPGEAPDDTAGSDWRLSYSLPPLPPPGAFDARFAGNYRLALGNAAVIHLRAIHYPLSVKFRNFHPGDRYIVEAFAGDNPAAVFPVTDGVQSLVISNPAVKKLVVRTAAPLPRRFRLLQNYPNPFNPVTIIRYQLPIETRVTLKVYDILGREVKTLVNERKPAGSYAVKWDGRDERGNPVASGVYFYRLTVGPASPTGRAPKGQARLSFVQTRKMLLLR